MISLTVILSIIEKSLSIADKSLDLFQTPKGQELLGEMITGIREMRENRQEVKAWWGQVKQDLDGLTSKLKADLTK